MTRQLLSIQYNVETGKSKSRRVWRAPAHAAIRGNMDQVAISFTSADEDQSGSASSKIYQLEDQEDEPALFASRSKAKRANSGY
jgi:hypothetical protein